jgi:hypothetical protein
MNELDWIDAGYEKKELGPDQFAWIRKLPNGSYILVTGISEYEANLPPEDGPFKICLYLLKNQDAGPSVSLELNLSVQPYMILCDIAPKNILVPILDGLMNAVVYKPI